MKRTYETKFNVGDEVKWNFFGMPEGFRNKYGQGRVTAIRIHQYRDGHYVRYWIESTDGDLVEDVPESCTFVDLLCGAV